MVAFGSHVEDSLDQKPLPDKMYFRIGEVSEIAGVPTYVLRFWETEFRIIRPKRTSSGQRLYRKVDVERIRKIKHLLYDKKFTIQGAKQHLDDPGDKAGDRKTALEDIRRELENIRTILQK